ncbi:MBL fold metallo-hydrolase [Streptococcus iniae]|uniref:Hydrolase n=1 Tax=Streptococcus iniae TaxID=1346 RepID=A0A3L8GHQ0_STRIN|nr:MBL fold metallo-hydrolase [Streptococcus iniae]AGM99091.1 metallo-beta-lactamase superfamily protein [Streptococcus iniae SF1]AHY16035.1 hydrolase [Streptococcus iniae]AHY17898.1 hydrolase [Streptococcus iniae]AJG26193.1 hydrolase [Streptococcus iniae]APD32071.1 MBL fold metallo-hydrolase [Streptococcus iniae]
MEIITILNQVAFENTYVLVNDQAALLIDPGSNDTKILKTLEAIQKPLVAILLTHTHYDHIMSLDVVRKTYPDVPVYVSEKEASWLFSPLDNLSGQIRHADLPDIITKPADHFFQYEKLYELSGFSFEVRETPGHSIGGVSFVFTKDQLLISGDALFYEGIGRYDLPTGNHQQLITSIQTKLFSLPNHFTVYPGHGPKTTIGHEKNFNPFLN